MRRRGLTCRAGWAIRRLRPAGGSWRGPGGLKRWRWPPSGMLLQLRARTPIVIAADAVRRGRQHHASIKQLAWLQTVMTVHDCERCCQGPSSDIVTGGGAAHCRTYGRASSARLLREGVATERSTAKHSRSSPHRKTFNIKTTALRRRKLKRS